MNPKNNTVITTGFAGGYDCVHFFSRLKNGRKNGIINSERIIFTEGSPPLAWHCAREETKNDIAIKN